MSYQHQDQSEDRCKNQGEDREEEQGKDETDDKERGEFRGEPDNGLLPSNTRYPTVRKFSSSDSEVDRLKGSYLTLDMKTDEGQTSNFMDTLEVKEASEHGMESEKIPGYELKHKEIGHELEPEETSGHELEHRKTSVPKLETRETSEDELEAKGTSGHEWEAMGARPKEYTKKPMYDSTEEWSDSESDLTVKHERTRDVEPRLEEEQALASDSVQIKDTDKEELKEQPENALSGHVKVSVMKGASEEVTKVPEGDYTASKLMKDSSVERATVKEESGSKAVVSEYEPTAESDPTKMTDRDKIEEEKDIHKKEVLSSESYTDTKLRTTDEYVKSKVSVSGIAQDEQDSLATGYHESDVSREVDREKIIEPAEGMGYHIEDILEVNPPTIPGREEDVSTGKVKIDSLIRELLIKGGSENERIVCEIIEQRHGKPPGTVHIRRGPSDELFTGGDEGSMMRLLGGLAGIRPDHDELFTGGFEGFMRRMRLLEGLAGQVPDIDDLFTGGDKGSMMRRLRGGLAGIRPDDDELFTGGFEGFMRRTRLLEGLAGIISDDDGEAEDVIKRRIFPGRGRKLDEAMIERFKKKREHSGNSSSGGSVISNADAGELRTGKKDEIYETFDIVEENSISYEKLKETLGKKKTGGKEIPAVGFDEEDENNPNERRTKGKPLKDFPDVKKSFTVKDCANPQKDDESPGEDLEQPSSIVTEEVTLFEDKKLVDHPYASDDMLDVGNRKDHCGVDSEERTDCSGNEKTSDKLKAEEPNTARKKVEDTRKADDSNNSHGMWGAQDTKETGDIKEARGKDPKHIGQTMDADETREIWETDLKKELEKKETEDIKEHKEMRETEDGDASSEKSNPDEGRVRIDSRTEGRVDEKILSVEPQSSDEESDDKRKAKTKDTSDTLKEQEGRNDANIGDRNGAKKQTQDTDSSIASITEETQCFPQPVGGEMSDITDNQFHLAGYPHAGTRQVTISFPSGAVQVSSS